MTLLLLALTTVSVAGWWMLKRSSAPAAPQEPPAPSVSTSLGPEDSAEKPLPRPGLDRRVLIAVRDLARLAGSTGDVTATPARDGWDVTCDGVAVGRLSEFPGFIEIREVVRGWARQSLPAMNLTAGTARSTTLGRINARITALRAMQALGELDRAWTGGEHDLRLAPLAARAYALLMVGEDRVGASDSLAGRALAWSMLAAANDSSFSPAECLIANQLGYSSEAYAMAASLPESDPIRAFVRREDLLLARAAAKSPDPTPDLFRLIRAGQRNDDVAWAALSEPLLKREPSLTLPILGSGLMLRGFGDYWVAGVTMLMAIATELEVVENTIRLAPHAKVTLASLIATFESLLDQMPASADGPIIDRAVMRSYYRTCLYSALRSIADHELFARASISDSDDLAAALRTTREGAGEEFARWLRNIADFEAGRPVAERLAADLTSLPHFGEPLLATSFFSLARSTINSGGTATAAGRAFVERLDTRPRSLESYSDAIVTAFWDLGATERVDSLLMQRIRPGTTQRSIVRAAHFGQGGLLLQIAGDSTNALDMRTFALARLEDRNLVDSTAYVAACQGLMAAHPREVTAVRPYAEYLESRGRYAEGARVVLGWLKRPDRSNDPLDDAFGRARAARLLQSAGRLNEALAVITPAVETWQFGAMQRAALILDDLGDHRAADSLAALAWGRYPLTDGARLLVIRLALRRQNDSLAFRAWCQGGAILDVESVRNDLVPDFRARFEKRTEALPDFIRRGLAANRATGISFRALANHLRKAGAPELAFAVQSSLPPDAAYMALDLVSSYQALLEARGRDAALSWVRPRTDSLGPRQSDMTALTAFQKHADDLLWELPWPAIRGESLEFFWVLRSAAHIRSRSAQHESHERELTRHYSEPSESRYHALGRYLMGMETESRILATAPNARALSETYYYIGFRNQAEGRIRDAAAWYARCAGLNQRANGEDHWARLQIREWQALETNLARIPRTAGTSPMAAL